MRHLSWIPRRTTPSLILAQLKEPDPVEKHLFWPLVQSFQPFWPESRWNRPQLCSNVSLRVHLRSRWGRGRLSGRAVTTWVCFHIIWATVIPSHLARWSHLHVAPPVTWLMSTNAARLITDRKHTDVSHPRPTSVTQHTCNNNAKGMSRNVAPNWGESGACAFLSLLLKVANRRQPERLVFMTACEGRICRPRSAKNRKGSGAETAPAVARTTVQNTVKLILTYDQRHPST